MTEQWAQVPDFPKYKVSNFGRVQRDDRENSVGVHENQQGIAYVSLMGGPDGDQQFHRGLARLVALAFLPRRNDAFDTPINLDGDRLHCHVENLEWRPRWFAIQYHMQFRKRWENPIESPLRDMETGEMYDNSWVVALTFGLLEKDVVLSVDNYTVCWPTFKRFQYAD
jgi:hypothetical protein